MNIWEGTWNIAAGVVKKCLIEVITETAMRNNIAISVLWENNNDTRHFTLKN